MEDFVITEETISENEPMLEFPEEPAGETAKDEFQLKVKYNGESKTLSRDEAVSFAQKGMNYDRVKEQLEQLKKTPAYDISESRFSELRSEIDSLRAREIADRKWAEFKRDHAEYNTYSELPEEVRGQIALGKELDDAYAIYENKLLKAKLRQIEQNQKNRDAAPGSLSSSGSGEMADDFLKGFLGM